MAEVNQSEPKRADFKQANPSDNPVDAEGKTAKQREVEAAQDKNQGSGQTEFTRATDRNYPGDAQGNFNKAAADLDPRNANANRDRPPVPGVDKYHGGSSSVQEAGGGGPDRGQPQYPLPNPNNPDSPNNPASTAQRDMLGRQSSPPLPQGARTTSETPMSGSSPAQREADRKRDSDR